MGVTTKFPGGVSFGSIGGAVDVAGVMAVARGSFDPTSSSQVELFTLPAGSVVVDVLGYTGSSGGTNPTVDIGTSGSSAGFANELLSDTQTSAVSAATGGALINTVLASDTIVYGKVGASAATGGTTAVAVLYIVTDN